MSNRPQVELAVHGPDDNEHFEWVDADDLTDTLNDWADGWEVDSNDVWIRDVRGFRDHVAGGLWEPNSLEVLANAIDNYGEALDIYIADVSWYMPTSDNIEGLISDFEHSYQGRVGSKEDYARDWARDQQDVFVIVPEVILESVDYSELADRLDGVSVNFYPSVEDGPGWHVYKED